MTTPAERIERRHESMLRLVEWAITMRQRDELVREAAEAGNTKADIAAIIGVHRSTVYEILARKEAK